MKQQPAQAAPENSQELARLYAEDQSDRLLPSGEQINWTVVAPRDAARLARVKEMCEEQALQTGVDYYHAAMIFQHAHEPEDYLLAHELCIIAISKGNERAKWLAAASEDRYLMNTGRPQRFGTQYCMDKPGGDYSLYEVAPGLSDWMRRAFNCPSLSEAQAEAEQFNKKPAPPAS